MLVINSAVGYHNFLFVKPSQIQGVTALMLPIYSYTA